LKVFDQISDTSKILFNCGVIHATLGEHEKAVCEWRRGMQLHAYTDEHRSIATSALCVWTSISPLLTSSRVCRTS
jgi:hypothetical protein